VIIKHKNDGRAFGVSCDKVNHVDVQSIENKPDEKKIAWDNETLRLRCQTYVSDVKGTFLYFVSYRKFV